MSEFIKSNLRAMWLTVAALSMTLPIFVPSFNTIGPLSNVIGTATLMMFILSFPSGLLAEPILFAAGSLFGIDPNAIGGEYLGVCLMLALGAAQWFWLVPRLWRRQAAAASELPQPFYHDLLADAATGSEVAEQTPLERILKD
jgi:hypothetical protein